MSTVGQNVEYTSPKQNSKHDEIAEYNGPKHNAKHDAQHPPTLYTSKSLNLSRRKVFSMTGSQKYRLRSLRRTKTMSEIAKQTANEEEYHGKVRVLDQPDKWCIYRVPSKLRKVNEAAYTPQLLSIGPFHHGKPELKDMETHKKIYYENFLARCKKSKDELKRFIKTRQENILRCYAGTIELDIDPADIIAVDACFIIELFLTNFYETENHKNDYILRSPWLRKAVEQDLILFENQLPYSLLQELYHDFAVPVSSSFQPCKEVQEQTHRQGSTNDLLCCWHCLHCSWRMPSNDYSIDIVKAEPAHDDHLLKLTCEFFKDYSKGKSVKNGVKPKHFTNLVRHFRCSDKAMACEHKSTPVKKYICCKEAEGIRGEV